MKIEKPSNTARTSNPGVATARTNSAKNETVQQQSGTSVSLGSNAAQLSSMQASMANAPVVDANKVAQIKQAISNGNFKVNSAMVADRLIQSVHDLINNKQA